MNFQSQSELAPEAEAPSISHLRDVSIPPKPDTVRSITRNGLNGRMTIEIDLANDSILTDFGMATLNDGYLLENETSPQEAFARAAIAFADDEAHAQRIYNYVSKLWFMFATPLLTNGGTKRGLPISCFLNYVDDSRESILNHYTENGWIASMGGGIGTYWGAVRSKGQRTRHKSRTSGQVKFVRVVDSEILAFSQGETRRGSYQATSDMSHPEIREFITIRKPGGDIHTKAFNIHHCVNIPDSFMQIIKRCMIDPDANDDWPLIDPHTGETIRIESAKSLWELLMETRMATGEPYIHYIDTSNRAMPETMKAKGLKINNANLCVEITLPTAPDRTAVCCLSSLNGYLFDEWKDDELFLEDMGRMLDNTLQTFINDSKELEGDPLWRARYSAEQERSIGLGLMGFHSYLQKKNVPIESAVAKSINNRIYSHVKKGLNAASLKLGEERGEAPDMEGTGERFSHKLANAPNATSSIICGGTSPSIETIPANVFTHKTKSGSFEVRNQDLARLLETYDRNDEGTWLSIVENKGSVQHLDFLSQHEKDVFKTSYEVDQMYIIELAADRQKHICMAQSLNIFVEPTIDIPRMHQLHYAAWARGVKTMYYCRSKSVRRPESVRADNDTEMKISTTNFEGLRSMDDLEIGCRACEG